LKNAGSVRAKCLCFLEIIASSRDLIDGADPPVR